MSNYNQYTQGQILMRRIAAVTMGVLAFPFMLFYPGRARFYSYLHRVWVKTSDKPVWLDQAELTVETSSNSAH
nr:YbfA family protein [uncultured Moellerella sp.]